MAQILAQVPTVSLGFHNETKAGILVQGATMVNGMWYFGAPFLVPPGKTGFDMNIPAGSARYISIYDSTNPSVVLLLNVPVQVLNFDQLFSVRYGPNGQIVLVPKK